MTDKVYNIIRAVNAVANVVLTVRFLKHWRQDIEYLRDLSPEQRAHVKAFRRKQVKDAFVFFAVTLPLAIFLLYHLGDIGSAIQKFPSYLPKLNDGCDNPLYPYAK
jgi:hypothetical protein